ncbi:acetyl-CoA C-acetyltransferase [Mycoplasmatota bacterium WC44]
MSKVYIVAAKRTAIGNFLGTLSTVSAGDLGATVVKNILEETKVDPAKIDEVIVGNILPAGQGQGIGRQVSIKAGIPYEVPGYVVSMVCGSGMKAIMDAYIKVSSGYSNLIVAGGAESMSQAPHLLPANVRTGAKMGNVVALDHMIYDALTDAYEGYHMGVTAENIVEKYNISREAQDEFAISSQTKAIQAVDAGKFKDEIVPVEVKLRRESITFDTDEYPNRRTNLDKLGTLRAVFKKGGSVTAGNASGINDGAAFLMVASEEAVNEYGLTPLAEIVSVGQGGVDPSIMGMGPVPAIKSALDKSELKLENINLIELNEAFASQSLGVVEQLSTDHSVTKEWILERANVNGGAIALGHPVGCSGARIVVTLIHEMKKRNDELGLASLCIGGGMGTAIILKNV